MTHSPRIATMALLLLAAAGCGTRTANDFSVQPRIDNEQARRFADLHAEYVARLKPLYRESKLTWWEANITGTDQAFERQADADKALLELRNDPKVFDRIKAFRDGGQITDPVLARLLDVMYRAFLPAQADAVTQQKIITLQSEAEQIFNTHRGLVDGQPRTENDIRKILIETADSKSAREAWRAYMDVGGKVQPQLTKLVELRNQQARALGFDNFYDLQLALVEIDRDELFDLFDELDELTRQPFAELKKSIDAARAEHFGISVDQLRPWHYGDLFFQEAPPVETVNLDDLYKGRDLLPLAEEYFSSLGMPVKKILARSDLYEKPGKSPHAFSEDLDRAGDVRILCNLKSNLMWMDTLLHELGHAVYDDYLDPGLPFLLRQASNGLTTEGIALMFGTVSLSPQFLTDVVKIEPRRAAAYAQAARNTLRTQKLIFSRWAQVMVRFEQGMYSNPHQDLAKLWWDLKAKYQLLNPPDDLTRPDYGAKNHIVTTPAYYHNYMLGDLFACQVQQYIAYHVLAPPDPANTCFHKRKEVGEYLKRRVFGPGTFYSWNDLTRHATGEPLTAKHFAAMYVAEPTPPAPKRLGRTEESSP